METIKKIYFYKMTVDNGGAPCVHNNVLSLAICKPQIRLTAQEGDWIIGFGGKDLGERLIYIAQITEKLSDGKYYEFEQYFDRPDCIYRCDMETGKYYWEKGKKYHQNEEYIEHDLQNKNVLLSNKFTYFGNLSTDEYKEKYPLIKEEVEALGQGHRVNHETKIFDKLSSLINENIIKNINAKPTDDSSCKSCGDIEGELVSCFKSDC